MEPTERWTLNMKEMSNEMSTYEPSRMETTSIRFNHEHTHSAIILHIIIWKDADIIIIMRIKATTKKTLIIMLPLWSIQAPNKHTVLRQKLNE